MTARILNALKLWQTSPRCVLGHEPPSMLLCSTARLELAVVHLQHCVLYYTTHHTHICILWDSQTRTPLHTGTGPEQSESLESSAKVSMKSYECGLPESACTSMNGANCLQRPVKRGKVCRFH